MDQNHPIITTPDWNRLFSIALEQEGYFTTAQAADAGFGPQLLHHHLDAGRFQRPVRGVYRLVHFPPGDHEELVIAWLWTGRQGIVGLESALALHGLSDALPAEIHMVLPQVWSRRRLRVPAGVCLHFHDLCEQDIQWHGAVPVTSLACTLRLSTLEHLPPDLIQQAAEQGMRRGLFSREDVAPVWAYLEAFHLQLEHA
ncbi:MAG: type IV toxin-antitoxin system AbiEi family antitoxin domain-containing protein [Myxococcota bacterium]